MTDAPSVRSVDDLSDTELDMIISQAWPYSDPSVGGPVQRKYARDLYELMSQALGRTPA